MAGRRHAARGRPLPLALQVVDDLALVPDVIAGGEDVDAEVEKLVDDLRSDAEAAGGVFAVGDNQVDAVLLLTSRADARWTMVRPGPSEDVADEENAQCVSSLES